MPRPIQDPSGIRSSAELNDLSLGWCCSA
jgi:hypothetical protein